jgi:pimeloyl-ACP methyl ester carboxylesterase
MSVAVSKERGSIMSSEGLPIRYDLYLPRPAQDNLPVVLFIHGFMGFKDWGPFPDVCYELAAEGFAVIAMDFSLNGIGDVPGEFGRPELLERGTFTQDLSDIRTVIDGIISGEIRGPQETLDHYRIGIIGHSRGGHCAIVAAAEFTEIISLVTWAAIADYTQRWGDGLKADWETKGYTEVTNSRTGQVFKVNKVVYDDLRNNADRLLAINRVRELYIPCLFIHGKDDESVPYTECNILYENCPSSEKRRIMVEGTGHTFGGVHPFNDDELPPKFLEVLDATNTWFKDTLR